MQIRKIQIISLLLLGIILVGSVFPVSSQDESTEASAEIVAQIDEPSNEIPAVKVTEYTSINISVRDAFGIPWEQLSSNMPIMARYVWPIIHPNWKPFLGYSSLAFETEIIQGDGRGWFHKVEPSAIANADQGRNYNLTLSVKTDDISVDYAVVVGIKVIRKDTSGNEMGVSYIYVPVKSSQLNNVKMDIVDTSKEAAPKSYVSYEAEISNRGYYRSMFELQFDHDENLTVSTENKIIVLESGETKKVNIQVLTAEKLFDIGTPYEIKISALSSGDPNPMHVGTIRVISKGMYISPLILVIVVPIIIILVIVFVVLFLIKEKRDRQIYGKPDKPWTLPSEKKYLQELKEKDSKEYQKVMDMMTQEYESALLWWKSVRQEQQEDNVNFSNILPRIKKKFKIEKDEKSKPTESKEENLKDKSVKKKTQNKSADSKKKNEDKKEQSSEDQSESEDIKESSSQKNQGSEDVNKEPSEKQSPPILDKIVSGLKKWFTVPEEEKQKESSEKMHATKSVEKKPKEKTEKQSRQPSEQKQEESKTDYEQELDRIEKEQKQLRAQKEKQRERSQKQKAIEKIKKAEKKQKRKWSL